MSTVSTSLSEFWSLDHITRLVDGVWMPPPRDGIVVTGVSTDTRTLRPGELFVAISGQNFDGHDYIEKAFQAGASAAMGSRLGDSAKPTMLVDHPIPSLGTLAKAYREVLKELDCKVIAVAGSNGKTTTRMMIHHILTMAGMHGHQSPKNYNNELGVPLTLLGTGCGDEETRGSACDFVVVEIGTNHPGEVAALAQIVQPDFAVITSIGREHLEHFGSIEAVEREEFSLLEHLAEGGTAWTPKDAPPSYDGPLSLPGAHNRANAAFAVAVAKHLGVRDEVIEQALAIAPTPPGRLVIEQLPTAEITLIDDSYNANPDSMLAALNVLKNTAGKRQVAILGDMLELGPTRETLHRELAESARQQCDVLLLCGEVFSQSCSDMESETLRVRRELTEQVMAEFAETLCVGDVVLVKGSRGSAMERIIPEVRDRFGDSS